MNWRSEDGYSLLELVVVLGIAGLVFALAAPQLQRAGGATSPANVATKLIAELSDLRARALSERRSIIVRAPQTGARNTAEPHVVALSIPGVEWRAASKGKAPDRSDLTFFPDGTVSAGELRVLVGVQSISIVAHPWSGRFEVRNADAKN